MKTVELDVVFLSYDEPNADQHYADLCNKVPWAKRIHGVKGSDAAHKAAAELSETDWVITVDADNIVDNRFFNLGFDPDNNDIQVYSWLARNRINGLLYGNGGLKIWRKDFILNMKSHEAANSNRAQVDFCWEEGYQQFKECYSETIITGSPFQAWRAGFREGVKMCLDTGRKPTVSEFRDRVHRRNLDHLTVWHNVGDDVEHGIWSIMGARMGTYKTMLSDWDHREVQCFDALEQLWSVEQYVDPYQATETYAKSLHVQLDLPMNILSPDQSRFFKHHYRSNWSNQGVMVREIDIIRKQEGW
jgi:hypothetical protein